MPSATPIPVGNAEQFHHGAECQQEKAALDLDTLCAQLRSSPDGLAAYDTALRCIHASDAVARYGFGRRPDDESIVAHLARAGFQVVNGSTRPPATLARLFRPTKQVMPTDGSFVVLRSNPTWTAREDTVMLVSAPDYWS